MLKDETTTVVASALNFRRAGSHGFLLSHLPTRSCSTQITLMPWLAHHLVRRSFSVSESMKIAVSGKRLAANSFSNALISSRFISRFLHKNDNECHFVTGGAPIFKTFVLTANCSSLIACRSVGQLPTKLTSCSFSISPFIRLKVCTSAPPKLLSNGNLVNKIFIMKKATPQQAPRRRSGSRGGSG